MCLEKKITKENLQGKILFHSFVIDRSQTCFPAVQIQLTLSPAALWSPHHENPPDRSDPRTVCAQIAGLLAHGKTCRTHSLSLRMQGICLAIWLMLQLGATSNCRSRINTYSEKGNGANQTTPQSIEEGNWFKDETQACVPMRRACQPSFSLSSSLSFSFSI